MCSVSWVWGGCCVSFLSCSCLASRSSHAKWPTVSRCLLTGKRLFLFDPFSFISSCHCLPVISCSSHFFLLPVTCCLLLFAFRSSQFIVRESLCVRPKKRRKINVYIEAFSSDIVPCTSPPCVDSSRLTGIRTFRIEIPSLSR